MTETQGAEAPTIALTDAQRYLLAKLEGCSGATRLRGIEAETALEMAVTPLVEIYPTDVSDTIVAAITEAGRAALTSPAPFRGGEDLEGLSEVDAEGILRDAWVEFGGSHQSQEFWSAFSSAVNFTLARSGRLVARSEAGDGRGEASKIAWVEQRIADARLRLEMAERQGNDSPYTRGLLFAYWEVAAALSSVPPAPVRGDQQGACPEGHRALAEGEANKLSSSLRDFDPSRGADALLERRVVQAHRSDITDDVRNLIEDLWKLACYQEAVLYRGPPAPGTEARQGRDACGSVHDGPVDEVRAPISLLSPSAPASGEGGESQLHNDNELASDQHKLIAHLEQQCRDFIRERDEWKAAAFSEEAFRAMTAEQRLALGRVVQAYENNASATGKEVMLSEAGLSHGSDPRGAHVTSPCEEVRSSGGALERVRHVKRGTEYEVLGEAEGQVSTGDPAMAAALGLEEGGLPFRSVCDETKIVIYRCIKTGKLWWRFPDEMTDGRFAPARTQAPAPAETRED